jgi:hypothetical protein
MKKWVRRISYVFLSAYLPPYVMAGGSVGG